MPLEDLYKPLKTETLTSSDQVYLDFRRTVEPGMFDAKFDVTPAKSCAIRSKHTGERLTDQTLRSHLLNGASFGARLNHALRQLDAAAALSDDELLEALLLFACHDLHKTIPAQRRRAEADSRKDADKDIPESEVEYYVNLLRLEEFDTDLEMADYRASALAAEEGSGRHREEPSRSFESYRDWVRVMDAAAGLSSPVVSGQLESRVRSISEDMQLASHRLDDSKGLLTNILNTTIVDRASDLELVVPLVFFYDGVLYLTTERDELIDELSGGKPEANSLTNDFIATMRDARDEFGDPRELTGSLSDDYQKGRIEIPSSVWLLAGLESAIKSVRHLLVDRAENSSYDDYNIYEYATTVGVSGGLFGDTIPEASKAVPLGLQISTFYQELYYPLSGEDRSAAIGHICDALGVEEQGSWIQQETEGWRLSYTQDSPATSVVERVADHIDVDANDVRDDLQDGISLESGGTLAAPVLLAMVYLARGEEDGTAVGQYPLEEVLGVTERRLHDYYRSWPEEWDDNVDVDNSMSSEDKVKHFERAREGMIWNSFPTYLARNLEVNGERPLELDRQKSKFVEYTSPTQPHVCLACHDLLEGSGSLADFESDSRYFGFTHYQPINPEGGEPSDAVCPQCEVEMTLRNSVYDTTRGKAQFVFLAPDYFFGPGDVEFARRVQEYVYLPGGFELQRLADAIVTGDQNRRSRQISDVFDTFGSDETAERSEFANLVKSYNKAYRDDGALGVYRLEPPRRAGEDGGGSDEITRVPNWFLSTFATLAIAWLTSSRALLTENPIPVTHFDEFPEMVRLEHLPGEVQRFSDDSVTISLLSDLSQTPEEITVRSRLRGQTVAADTDDAAQPRAAEALDPRKETGIANGAAVESQPTASESPVPVKVTMRTDFEVKLQQMASLITVTGQQHGADLQRVKTVLQRVKQPFPGAGTALKGDEIQAYPAALHAALVLDTIQHPTMSNRIDSLADAGFDTLHPDPDHDTNYEYERLFRVARDALSDGLAQNATRDELVDIVAGDVMKAAARADESDYGEERVKREPAETFAERFVDDVYLGICDGDFYELRRQENHLASGYNAAIRRREQAFWDEYSSDSDTDQ